MESDSSYLNSNQMIELGEAKRSSDMRESLNNSSVHAEPNIKCMVDVCTQASIVMETIPLQEITINVAIDQQDVFDNNERDLQ